MSQKNAVYPCLDVIDHSEWSVASVTQEAQEAQETVNHPAHYHAQSGVEVIEAIQAWDLCFALGNVVKYVARAGHKDPATRVEDLRKAQWYLARALEEASK